MDEMIYNFIGKIILIGGGAAGVAYALFVFLGKNWIENKFSERLESMRHQQASELEKLKGDINKLFSRATKIHQKEFEVLPIIWEKLQHAIGTVHALVTPIKQYPDFKRMSQPGLEELIKNIDLPQYKKDELLSSTDRQKYYEDAVYERELLRARNKISDYHNYIIFNRIFLAEDLRKKFTEIDLLLSKVSIKYEYAHEGKDYKEMHSASKEIGDNLDVLIDEVEKIVQERLHFDGA